MTGPTAPDPREPAAPSRSLELEVEVPGTPEEIWEAIATGPGVTSWYVPSEVEPRVGGRVTLDFGSFGTVEAVVSAWDPPHRFAYRGTTEEEPLAYEWIVEGRDSGTCVVRLVNSGFGDGDDWDGQYDAMGEGWQIFLQSLRIHLTHHRGQRAAAIVSTVLLPGPHRSAWDRFCQEMGLAPDLGPGDAVRTGAGSPPLAGRVESVLRTDHATTCLLLLDQPGAGTGFLTVEGDGEQVAGSVYLYLYGGDDQLGQAWPAWLAQRFPPLPELLPPDAQAPPVD